MKIGKSNVARRKGSKLHAKQVHEGEGLVVTPATENPRKKFRSKHTGPRITRGTSGMSIHLTR